MTQPGTRRHLRLVLFVIASGVLVLDQLTKAAAVALLEGRPPIPIIGDLAGFAFYRNPGAALGLGAGTTWLFAVIAIAVFIGILLIAGRLGSRAWTAGLGLLLGGLTGNLIDRLFRPPGFFHGAVVDFIDLHFFICNVADIAITAAACVIILATMRNIGIDGRRPADEADPAEQTAAQAPDSPDEERQHT